MISNRAKALQSKPSAIMVGHMICADNPYSLENAEGYINFGTAENHLMADLLLPKINEQISLAKEHIQYNTLYGLEDVRETVCSFFENYLGLKDLYANNLVIQTGVSSICESMSFSMFDAGDQIMIPTPYYTGFDHDFTKRFGCDFLKVHLSAKDNFKHDIFPFLEAYKNSEKDKVKAVLITHPHNPTGEVLSERFMDDIIQFCLKNDLNLISDEIYALSTYKQEKHISLYQRAVDAGVKAHFLYGMAKDFSLAGLKVGFYYSTIQDGLESLQNVSYFHPVSTHTQLLIKNLLSDHTFLDQYIPLNQKRLTEIPHKIISELRQFKFIPTDSGLFMLLNLSKYIDTFEKEEGIFLLLLETYKINLTPGKALGLETPGYFRVCFARDEATVNEFIERMKQFSL